MANILPYDADPFLLANRDDEQLRTSNKPQEQPFIFLPRENNNGTSDTERSTKTEKESEIERANVVLYCSNRLQEPVNVLPQEIHETRVTVQPDKERQPDQCSFDEKKRKLSLNIAAVNGDWEAARGIITNHPNLLIEGIGIFNNTVLHIAASANQSEFVEKLVDIVSEKDLEIQTTDGSTALHFVAIGGCTGPAKAMVKKNSNLPQIVDKRGWTPLVAAIAAGLSKEEMIWYLCSVTPRDTFTGPWAGFVAVGCVLAGYYDVILHLVKIYPNLATAQNLNGNTMLEVLCCRPSAFLSGNRLGLWERYIYQWIPVKLKDGQQTTFLIQLLSYLIRVFGVNKIHDKKLRYMTSSKLVREVLSVMYSQMKPQLSDLLTNVAFSAAEHGIEEIVMGCLQLHPDLVWGRLSQKSLLKVAIKYRQENIVNLLRERNWRNASMVHEFDASFFTTLHLVAKLPQPSKLKVVSGPALQMQRELQWFKEVEKRVPLGFQEYSSSTDQSTAAKETPWELFIKEHRELVMDGEKWMKDTSNSCMVVATLIATVVFAAAFTIPGGTIQDKGTPIFFKSTAFKVFVISDGIGLFSSSTSLLMFLSILTARYAEIDFLSSLPKRLILGLGSLFFAVASMMTAFSATLWIVLGDGLKLVSILIILLVCIPVTLFALLQIPLFIEMFQTTFGSGIFRNKQPKFLNLDI